MSTNLTKSTRSKLSSKVRTINTRFDSDRLCRYLLSGNRRCQRIQTNTGSGLCILHDRHLTQLRDAQSEALGNQALGQVTDFNSAISIHAVLSRIVMLGLHRRYSTKEVSVFTYAMQSLRQTLEEAAYELRHHSGHNSRNPFIARAIDNEPSPTVNAGEIPPPIATPTQTFSAIPPDPKIIDPSDIADVLESGYLSSQSKESVDNLLNLPTTPNDANAQESVGARLAAPAEDAEIIPPQPTNPNPQPPTPHPHADKPWIRKDTPDPSQQSNPDPNDGSIPYTHMQSYGGITVPLHGRLRIGPDDMSDAFPKPKTPKPVKFFRGPRRH